MAVDNTYTSAKLYEYDGAGNKGSRYLQVTVTQTRGSSSQNYSTINWSLYAGGTSYYTDTGPTTLKIGSKTVFTQPRVGWGSGTFPAKNGTKTGSFNIDHNADGTIGNLAVTLSSALNTGSVSTVSGTLTMSSIARYFSSTPSISLIDQSETSLKFNWTTSETCSSIKVYRKLSTASSYGTEVKTLTPDASSGTFEITGLAANTTYNVYISAQRKDSGQWSDSNTETKPTYNWPYVKSINVSQLTIGSNPTLTIYNPMGRTVSIHVTKDTADSSTVLLPPFNFSTKGLDVPCEITTFNTDTLYNSIPDSQIGTAIYYCKYNNTYYNTVSGIYKIVGNELPTIPSVMFTFSEQNSTISNLKPGGYVQKLSKITGLVTAIPTGNKGASIKSCTATLGGVTRTVVKNAALEWNNLNISGNQYVTVTATDTRNLTHTSSWMLTYIPYEYPTVALTAGRVNNYGDTVELVANYTSSSVNSKNTIEISYKGIKDSDGTTASSGYLLNAGSTATNGTTTKKSIANIANSNTYTFSATIKDKFGQTSTSSVKIPIGTPIMFVDSTVLGVGINKFPTSEGLHSDKVYLNKTAYITYDSGNKAISFKFTE